MILIADSGSTHTGWQIISGPIILQTLTTSGINPYFQDSAEIAAVVQQELLPQIKDSSSVDRIFFYGAGCAFDAKKAIVATALRQHFPQAIIEVESDLLGAARGLFQQNAGIACILGTGSNSCAYDGTMITHNVSPLGYILGDEGSGAHLGKLWVADCLKHRIPEWLSEKWMDEYELTTEMIIDRVYRQPFPNRFLASFTPFLSAHIDEPAVFNLVYEAFDAFLMRNVMQYDLAEKSVGFVGSIAYHFRDTLEIVAMERHLEIETVTTSPLEGLALFHSL